MIRVASFGILTPVKLGHLFYFIFLRGYLGLMSFNIRFVFYWVVPISWPGLRIWQVNLVDLIDFFPSIYWELGLMIYFGLIFMRLFWPHDPKIVLNRLTHIDLAYFYAIFLIKFFINSIV
jgi:hypothetical protein